MQCDLICYSLISLKYNIWSERKALWFTYLIFTDFQYQGNFQYKKEKETNFKK